MFKAIETRYKGPTDTRGSRIIAADLDGNRITIPYDHALNHDELHERAAKALCEKMGWQGEIVGGATKSGYAFVFTS